MNLCKSMRNYIVISQPMEWAFEDDYSRLVKAAVRLPIAAMLMRRAATRAATAGKLEI